MLGAETPAHGEAVQKHRHTLRKKAATPSEGGGAETPSEGGGAETPSEVGVGRQNHLRLVWAETVECHSGDVALTGLDPEVYHSDLVVMRASRERSLFCPCGHTRQLL